MPFWRAQNTPPKKCFTFRAGCEFATQPALAGSKISRSLVEDSGGPQGESLKRKGHWRAIVMPRRDQPTTRIYSIVDTTVVMRHVNYTLFFCLIWCLLFCLWINNEHLSTMNERSKQNTHQTWAIQQVFCFSMLIYVHAHCVQLICLVCNVNMVKSIKPT